MQVSRVACRASSMMKPARSPLQDNTTETKNRGGEARGAPKYLLCFAFGAFGLAVCILVGFLDFHFCVLRTATGVCRVPK